MRDLEEERRLTGLWLRLDPAMPARVGALSQAFDARFGPVAGRVLGCAPGRAEVIGSHTDYNEGYTLSSNIGVNVLVMLRRRMDHVCTVASLNLRRESTFPAESAAGVLQHRAAESESWARYPQSVVWSFLADDLEVPGFDALIHSTIPHAGGMSSSAALETAIARAICGVTETAPGREAQVVLTKRGENDFVGAPCGYLDQATVGLARGWLFLDHRPGDGRRFHRTSIEDGGDGAGFRLLVGFDPGSSHRNTDGRYAERREACRRSVPALAALLNAPQVTALRDVSASQFQSVRAEFVKAMGTRVAGFVEHVVNEDERVPAARTALERADFVALGELMNASGSSAIGLLDLAEGCPELRVLHETVAANAREWGVAGMRTMGAGFNATSITLVRTEAVEGFRTALASRYTARVGRPYQTIACSPTPAAGLLDLSALLAAAG